MRAGDELARACSGLRLGLVVPARDEALVIERRLRGLLSAPWPPAARHRLVVVDDGSGDGTADLARALLRPELLPTGVRAEVVPNHREPGKPGAVGTGLDRLRGPGGRLEVDVVVVSDADVVLAPEALLHLAAAFRGDPDLALACGEQRFVRALADSGLPEGPKGTPLEPAGGLYDRITALVRRLESRSGRLFSLHGQLMAWRARLELAPRPGIAADDLDLVLQLRARRRTSSEPWRARLVPGALFHEVKTPAGEGARAQALRRARAYVQALRSSPVAGGDGASRLQGMAYRFLPLWAPELALGGLVLLALAVLILPLTSGLLLAGLVLAVLLSPAGRRALALLALIRAARRLEDRGAQPERWEMAR